MSGYDEALAAYSAARRIIDDFSEAHPLLVPDPDRPGTSWHIKSPVPHRLRRDEDTLSCTECGVSVHAPSPPKRPLTPMEASLSRFD